MVGFRLSNLKAFLTLVSGLLICGPAFDSPSREFLGGFAHGEEKTVRAASKSSSKSKPAAEVQLGPQLWTRIQRFAEGGALENESEDKLIVEWNSITKAIPADALTDLEKRLIEGKSEQLRWAFYRTLMERDRYDSAARILIRLFVDCSDEEAKQRHYGFAKQFAVFYGERKDVRDIQEKLLRALFAEYKKGDEKTRLAIARICGRGKAESQLPPDKFARDVIKLKETPQKDDAK